MMRWALWLAAVSAPAAAQTPAQTLAEAALLPRLIETICVELVEASTGCEQVTLLTSETDSDSADLMIYPDRRGDGRGDALLVVRGLVFDGAMWGMAPSLEAVPGGALRLRSEQSGIGRYPWFESLDVAHDGTAFVITRYSYSAYDRALPRSVSCEVDFLAGTARAEWERGDPETDAAMPEVHLSTARHDIAPPHLRDWNMAQARPPHCSAAIAAAFADD